MASRNGRSIRWKQSLPGTNDTWVVQAFFSHYTARKGRVRREWHVTVNFGLSRVGLHINAITVRPADQTADENGAYVSINSDALRVPIDGLIAEAEAYLRSAPDHIEHLIGVYRDRGDAKSVEHLEARLAPTKARSAEIEGTRGSRRGRALSDEDDRDTALLFLGIYQRIDEERRPPRRGEVYDEMKNELGIGLAAVRARVGRATRNGWLTEPTRGVQRRGAGPRLLEEDQ